MSAWRRNGAGGHDLHLHIGCVVIERKLMEGIGADPAQCAERIEAALRGRHAGESVMNEPRAAAHRVAHAIWGQVGAAVSGAGVSKKVKA